MTIVRNQWYAAAWDGEVTNQLLARTICGEPLVLYRKLNGAVVALRDACPHRLLPLSLGLREGDSIRCRYHGMKLACDGAVEEMPLRSDRAPRNLCATAYPAIERHRFIWVWIGEAESADPALIPDLWPCSRPGWVFDGGYYRIGCEYRLLIDNLMDLTHETYVHMDSIGQAELLETAPDFASEGDVVTVTRWMPGITPPPFWRTALRKDGPVDRWQICRFVAPSNVMIDVGVAPVGSGATIESHDQGVRGMVINAITPGAHNEVHYFWGMARNFDIQDHGLTERLKRGQLKIFGEDVEILERQQQSIDQNPDMKLRIFSIDAGGAHVRRVIDRLASATLQPEVTA
jgi:phenylpropionate dioxygenase-like ring-hydroxylating dioxygenase large terminal subunit